MRESLLGYGFYCSKRVGSSCATDSAVVSRPSLQSSCKLPGAQSLAVSQQARRSIARKRDRPFRSHQHGPLLQCCRRTAHTATRA